MDPSLKTVLDVGKAHIHVQVLGGAIKYIKTLSCCAVMLQSY